MTQSLPLTREVALPEAKTEGETDQYRVQTKTQIYLSLSQLR